ncbi:MAG: NADH-quinone oxidoreductase subunit NuoB [Anaerovoracaceae bacterium]|jgi:Ni,Fe-hydrogenase III small subunit/formate hydrogenlyase subunit 6/NADH:ubiquinone oxidoreductase subunit I
MLDKTRKMLNYPRLTQDSLKRPAILDYFPGNPVINREMCTICMECAERCPTNAIIPDGLEGKLGIDHGLCIYCMLCKEICPEGAIAMDKQIFNVEKDRQGLTNKTLIITEDETKSLVWENIGKELKAKIKGVFGRSLHIREVDSGSCNGCDYEINALNNPFIDVERFGISFVASPRHADMLLVTGTAVRNMEQALIKTYNATPDPKLVVAVGSCACSGGIFRDTYATNNGIDTIVPVDVYVPGCPPRPQAIVYGILQAIK